jgi:hypothetical protein
LYPSIEAPEFNHPAGDVEPGFTAGIDATGGTVYYTIDGTDPRLPGGGISPSALSFVPTTELVGTSTVVRAFVPSGPQSAAGWTSAVFDDSGWLSGPNPAGFDLTPAPLATAVPLQNATADFSESGDNIGQVLDAKPTTTGWGLLQPDFVNKGRGAVAVFQTVSNLGGAEGTLLTFQLQHGAAGQGALGKFRLSVTRDDRGTFADGKPNHGDVTANWTPLQPLSAASSGGATLRITPERTVLATGLNPSTDTYTVTALTPWSDITGFRIEALEDSALPNRGPGRNSSGDALLTDFSIRAAPATLQPVLKTPFNGLAAAVHGVNASVYLRYPFTLPNSPAFQHLILRVRYDDGFVAYLNGHEVARRNAPDALDWNSAAIADRRLGSVLEFEEIDLSAGLPWLQPGANVLAVQAMTHSGDAPDLLFESQLIAKTDVAIPVADALTLRARAFDARGWSALTESLFTVSAPLRVTEIMHHPPDATVNDGDDYQFVEIQNVGAAPYPLGGLGFTSGIKYIFPAGSSLGAGQFLVLARNPARFAARYPGVPVAGAFTGKLSHSGDTLVISRLQGGQVVLRVQYSDSFPWPPAADGLGFSLVPRDPQAVPGVGDGTAWRASAAPLGSPGGPDPQPAIPPILVNEVLSAAVPPQVDTIELANPTAQPVSVAGWFLTDDRKQPFKFRILDPTPIPAHGFRLFTATEYGPPATPAGFELSGSGDSVYVFSGDASTNLTGYAHGFSFGASARGGSFGHYVTSVGEEVFPAQSSLTLPGPNAGPRIGPVVLSEIHYHPPAGNDPFVELKNISDSPVPLFDPAHPENTWRISGMGFSFPPALTLGPGGRLLVVAADPEAYRQRHAVDPGVIILGPYAGQLQASGERLELQQPGEPVASGVPMITLDEVRYNDHAPWPREADGFGASLQRVLPASYGNDPAAWVAARPGPGTDYLPSAGPRITQQPASASVAKGDVAQLSVGATGPDPLSFQWRFQGSAVDGGTGPILLLPNVQPSQAGFYEVTVFNAGGAVTSARALLSVLIPPSITSQPAGRTVAAGSNVTFSVTAAGTGTLHYQWRRSGTDVPGATGSSLLLPAVSVDQSGDYQVLVSDSVGSALSQPATLVVLVKPVIVAGPLDQSAVPGQMVSFVASVTGTPPLYYRWRVNGATLLTQVQNATTSVLTITNFQASQAGTVSISVSNALPGSLTTASATLAAASDADADGMADAWEKLVGLDPSNRADASGDIDSDGMSNLAEYIAGTDPRDPLSVLRLQAVSAPGTGVLLSFAAVSNRTYTIQYSGTLPARSWARLHDVAAAPTSGLRTLTDTAAPTNRYYRVVVPAQP